MRVLVACEESQTVCNAFRVKGHEAYSCDILPCSGGHPDWHIQGNVIGHLSPLRRHDLESGGCTFGGWDLMIAHPPCTWLCRAMRANAARKDRPKITAVFFEERKKAFDFFMSLYNAPIEKICVENPIGYVNSAFRKPNQIIHPYHFGHDIRKDTCLWLKGLPELHWTKFVNPPYRKIDYWSNKRNPDGRSLKSVTYQGIAKAMAEQWG